MMYIQHEFWNPRAVPVGHVNPLHQKLAQLFELIFFPFVSNNLLPILWWLWRVNISAITEGKIQTLHNRKYIYIWTVYRINCQKRISKTIPQEEESKAGLTSRIGSSGLFLAKAHKHSADKSILLQVLQTRVATSNMYGMHSHMNHSKEVHHHPRRKI